MRIAHNRTGMLALLFAATGACQSARVDRPQPPDAAARAAPDVVPPASFAADEGTGDTRPSAVARRPPGRAADAATGSAPAEAAPVAATAATGEEPPDSGYDDHCLEPPERDAARRNMRAMADRHARATEGLRALRTDLEAKAGGIFAALSLAAIDPIAAELVPRVAELHGGEWAGAGSLAVLLHQAASVAVLCRALRDGPGPCDRLEGAGSGDAGSCRSTVRLLELARERPGTIGWRSFISLTFGWQDEDAAAELIWQAALRRLPESWCDRLAVPDAPDHWARPLCRAVAARDPSRCSDFQGEWRRTTCGALVHALLGPEEPEADPPGAFAALLREWVASPETGPTCEAAARRVLDELLDAAGIFDPGTLVLPDVERARGLAPTP
ncbi:MAG: hypothetical protein HY907_10655 [Deltaproteobacteria bacterium]|nr:hypothetical protein [Deltaproteobacteria bacterium]